MFDRKILILALFTVVGLFSIGIAAAPLLECIGTPIANCSTFEGDCEGGNVYYMNTGEQFYACAGNPCSSAAPCNLPVENGIPEASTIMIIVGLLAIIVVVSVLVIKKK